MAAGSVCMGMTLTAVVAAFLTTFFFSAGAGLNCNTPFRARLAPTTSSGTLVSSMSESSSLSSSFSLMLPSGETVPAGAAAAGAGSAGAGSAGAGAAGSMRLTRAVGMQTASADLSSARFGVVSQSGPSEASGSTTITRCSMRRSYFLGGSAFRNSCVASNCASIRADAFCACRWSWRASALTFSAIPRRALVTSTSIRVASGMRMWLMMSAGEKIFCSS